MKTCKHDLILECIMLSQFGFIYLAASRQDQFKCFSVAIQAIADRRSQNSQGVEQAHEHCSELRIARRWLFALHKSQASNNLAAIRYFEGTAPLFGPGLALPFAH